MTGCTLLTCAILAGLVASGLTNVVRAVAPTWLLLRKPVACDLCMGWWGSLGTGLALWWTGSREVSAAAGVDVALTALGGVAVALLATKLVDHLR